jgi:hypothetical protein
MSKLSQVTLRVLGTFAIEANVGRPIALSIRSRKARALLAYLAMKQTTAQGVKSSPRCFGVTILMRRRATACGNASFRYARICAWHHKSSS